MLGSLTDECHFEAVDVVAQQVVERVGKGALKGCRGAHTCSQGHIATKDSIETALKEVGYPYTVSFSICPDEKQNISGVLFKGPHSTVYTNWENTGRIAFTRDGYEFDFGSFILPVGEWTDITIKGDWKGTSLYVNGKLQERLEGRKKRVLNTKYNRLESMPMQETLVFPLQHIGDKINGFNGKLKHVKVTQE
jgi:hexosaminidase